MKCTDEKWKLKKILSCRFEGKKAKDQGTNLPWMNESLFSSRQNRLKENRASEDLRYILCVFYRRELYLKCKFINQLCVIDFVIKLMLNSSKYFRKHAQILDSFVVKFSSHRLKILFEFKRAHYAGISEFHLSTETFGFSNKFFKK